MPMIGARFYTQFDSALLWGDMIEGELEKVRRLIKKNNFDAFKKELENGRLFRLLSKMSMVQCQPPAGAVLGQEQSWSESGERRLVRLFRNYLFRQRTDQGNPFLSLSHVIASLNKVREPLKTTRTNSNTSSTSGPMRRSFSTRMTTEQSSLQRTMTLNLQSTR
jgi:PAB-dependent poly(A)-specific ribonuclease subunit 3